MDRATEADEGTQWYELTKILWGTAGITFFLARLAHETGKDRFLEAALAGTEWILTTCRTDGDICAACHSSLIGRAGYADGKGTAACWMTCIGATPSGGEPVNR